MSALDDALGTLALARAEQPIVMNHMLPQARAELEALRASASSEKSIIDLLDKACRECRIDVTGLTASEKIDRLVDKIDEWRLADRGRLPAEQLTCPCGKTASGSE